MGNKYTVVDLFAGAGGLSKAFQLAGANIIWANEIDGNACSLYRKNLECDCLVEGDIKEIDSKSIPNFDILIAGFPCQSFSITGNSGRHNNERDYLFFDILRILKEKKPKAFLLESVKALLSLAGGNTLRKIIDALKQEGYCIKYQVLNLMRFGNIPHNKERLYIVGFREQKEYEMFEFPNEIQTTKKINDIISINDQKENKYYLGKSIDLIKKNKGDTLKKGLIYQLRYEHGFKGNYIVKEYEYCPPISTGTINMPLIVDNFGIRKLTPLECFKFQGYFDIKIPTTFSDHLLYKYAAGCSSVTVEKRIAENILKVLNNYSDFTYANNHIDQNESVLEAIDYNDSSDDNILSKMLKKVEITEDKYKKGKALELLIKLLFEQVDGFYVDTNVRTNTEEIDIFIRNESKSEFWKKESIFIIGECKNWNKKSGKNELVLFRSKIENRKDRVKLGFFISWNGFAETYTSEDLRGAKGDILIIPVTGQEIKECIINGNIESYLKKWYQNAVIL